MRAVVAIAICLLGCQEPTAYRMREFKDNGVQWCCMEDFPYGCNAGCVERGFRCLCGKLCECKKSR